jgi:hypothetical protein
MMDEEGVPGHVPFHEAVRIRPPACSVGGMQPRLAADFVAEDFVVDDDDETLAVRLDGGPVSTTVRFASVQAGIVRRVTVQGNSRLDARCL